jgi:tRNA-specific 2-thiouridylase
MTKSVLIAMSGGVDSTVAAILSQRDGFECVGATMRLFNNSDKTVEEARTVTAKLGLPFFVFDFSESFAKRVIEPFIDEYRAGRTPNPCIECNKHLKFGQLQKKALELGMESIATGHYAQVERDANGRYLLKKGADKKKDQSYVLYTLTQEQLSLVRFPLGSLTKSQVREVALCVGLDVAKSGESLDICFVPDGDYVKYITEYSGINPRKGRFIDTEGNILGENKGVISYTIGQRRGLGLALPYPPYVLELRPEDDTVVIGKSELLYSKTLTVTDINLIPFDKLDAPLKAQVKIRYSDPGHSATVHQTDENTIHIEFDESQRAITKGQSAVFYDNDIVIGGGRIE